MRENEQICVNELLKKEFNEKKKKKQTLKHTARLCVLAYLEQIIKIMWIMHQFIPLDSLFILHILLLSQRFFILDGFM